MNSPIPNKQSSGAGIGMLTGAANAAIGQGMGLLFGGLQDRRQRRQAEKLGEIQGKQNREMADYEQKLAKEMWDYTDMKAQREKMEEAGLSVGLMYGGSGAGGQTASGGGVSGVGGQSAGDPNAGIGMGMQLAAQMALMKAQKENIEADTENKKAEAGGRGEENVSKGVRARNDLATEAEQRDKILGEAKQASVAGVIAEMTQEDIKKRIHSEAVGAELDNTLTRMGIKLNRARINEIENSISQEWRRLALEGRKVTVLELQQAVDESMKRKGMILAQDGLDELKQQNMINNVLGAAGAIGGKMPVTTKKETDYYDEKGHKGSTITKERKQ